jgi:hypothetical protein
MAVAEEVERRLPWLKLRLAAPGKPVRDCDNEPLLPGRCGRASGNIAGAAPFSLKLEE